MKDIDSRIECFLEEQKIIYDEYYFFKNNRNTTYINMIRQPLGNFSFTFKEESILEEYMFFIFDSTIEIWQSKRIAIFNI